MNFFNIEFKEDDSYFYGCSLVSALQNKMLTEAISDTLIDYPIEDIIKKLSEFDYSSDSDIDLMLEKAEKNLYKKIREAVVPSSDSHLIDLLFLKNDFENLKKSIKKHFSLHHELNFDLNYTENSLVNSDIMHEIIKNKNFHKLPIELTGIAKVALEMKSKGLSNFYIDNTIDAVYLKTVLETARKKENSFLEYYFKNYVDLHNISTTLRLKKSMPDIGDLQSFFISYGSLNFSDFQFLFQAKLEDYVDFLSRKPYGEMIKESVTDILKTKSFLLYEKLKDNYLLSIAQKTKIVRNSIDSIIGYFFGKQNEIRNVHLILSSKKNNLDKETIKKRVRKYYV